MSKVFDVDSEAIEYIDVEAIERLESIAEELARLIDRLPASLPVEVRQSILVAVYEMREVTRTYGVLAWLRAVGGEQ